MSRTFLVTAALVAVLAATAPAAVAAADDGAVSYAPPVDAEVVDGFRPPSTPYGAGNRGIDYATAAGDDVHAAAAGVVVFAGRIGPAGHVVVLHSDGIRTSYSFLADARVRRGERVGAGDVVGTAAGPTHFGARAGEEYLDPTVLLSGGPPEVHLVPADQRDPLAEWEERQGVLESIGGAVGAALGAGLDALTPAARLVGRFGAAAVEHAMLVAAEQWTRLDESLRAWAHAINAPLTHGERIATRLDRVLIDQEGCTPTGVEPPPAPAAGRIAVLVAGLNSSSDGGAVLDVDTESLGYGAGMVTQFSYRGGQALGAPAHTMAGLPVTVYGRRDTHGDIRAAGARLRELLVEINRLHPGVLVDLIAHSLGGIVVRAAVTGADAFAPDVPVIANVVTLGSPHHGAVAATVANLLAPTPVGDLYDDAAMVGLPTGESTRQLASSSHLIDELGDLGLPAGTRVTSIAASGDVLVDAQMSAIDHATNVIVPVTGAHAHDALPGDPATARELALALGGMGPTCRDLGPDLALADAVNLTNGVRWVADRVAEGLVRMEPMP